MVYSHARGDIGIDICPSISIAFIEILKGCRTFLFIGIRCVAVRHP